MRNNLYVKFGIIYLIFLFVSFFSVSALSTPLTTNYLEKRQATNIYKDATYMASDYLPSYFSGKISAVQVARQLKGMSTYLDASVWFVGDSGTLIASGNIDGFPSAPVETPNFNPTELGSNRYSISNYHGFFPEKVITVIVPVTEGFNTNGYLLIHQRYATINDMVDQFHHQLYIMMTFLCILALVFPLGMHFLVLQPLKEISNAAREYASGNLDITIPVNRHDEMGYLSASLNYMSSQLKDIEDYQKKFIANVSHDFRSPLTSIKGYVQAMVDGVIPVEMQGKYLGIISFEVDRLTDLTRDLLTLNEFDTKELVLNRETFDIHEMIRKTASAFEGSCKEKKITLELVYSTRSFNVFADRRKIQQVLYNLIDNAIKFSPADSTIKIESTIRGEKIYISVKDEGMGIPKQNLNKIWDRFYKSDLSRGKDKKGTGLGLSIVKEAIQAHGENINVISTEGVGTEFVFSLTKSKIKE